MTQFGKFTFHNLVLARGLTSALAFAAALAVQFYLPTYPLQPLLFLLLAELASSFILRGLAARVSLARLVHASLWFDTAVITAMVFYTGGLDAGFASLYVWVPLVAALMLGLRWLPIYAIVTLSVFAVQALLELGGIQAAGARPSPPLVVFVSQFTLLVVLMVFAYLITRSRLGLADQMRNEKDELRAERTEAERARSRWQLVNAVALKIQAASSPEQIYSTIGQELERMQMHGVVLQWDEPDVSMHAIYGSMTLPGPQHAEQTQVQREFTHLRLDQAEPLRRCVEMRAPVFLENARVMEIGNVTQLIYAPMMVGERVTAVLCVWSKSLDANDIPPLAALAQQAASALERAMLLAQVQKRAAQLQVVSEISTRASGIHDPQDLIEQVVAMVGERFNYHILGILLVDRARNDLYVAAAYGQLVRRLGNRYRQSLDVGIIGSVVRSGQTYLARDVRSDPNYIFPLDSTDPVRSELTIPLRHDGEIVGVLDAQSTRVDAFDASDVTAMETLAEQMAAALEKARLLKSERKRAAQLALVSRVSSRVVRLLPLDELLRQGVESIQHQFGYFNTAIFLNDPSGRQVVLNAAVGQLESYAMNYRQSWDVGIIGHVAQSGQTYVCADTRQDKYYHPGPAEAPHDPVRSELTVPLMRGERVLGVLDIQSEHPHAFDEGDVAAMETLADQIATAVENTTLFAAESRRAEELETIRQLSLELIAERELSVLLQSIVEKATRLLQADGATLYSMDATRGELNCEVSYQMPRDYTGMQLKIGEGLVGNVAAQGEPIFVNDYKNWSGRAAIFADEPVAALMGIPLRWQSRVLGVITLYRADLANRFTPDELRLAKLFAAQAAFALENANLLSAVHSQLQVQRTLTSLSRTLLETLDSKAVLQRAASSIAQVLNADGVIMFLPRGDGSLGVGAQHGWEDALGAEVTLPATQESIPGTVMLTHRISMWNENDPISYAKMHPIARARGFRAGISVPMLVGGQAVGVITVNTRTPRVFNEQDMQTLALLANQTAIALERVRYFEQVQQSAREMNLLFEAHRATTATLQPEQVISRLLEQLTKSLDATSAYFIRVDVARGTVTQEQEFFSAVASERERVMQAPSASLELFPELREMLTRGPLITQLDDPSLSAEMRQNMLDGDGQSILRVPLRAADQVLGYVSLWESRAPRSWTESEIRFSQTMASHAAAALTNARLYEDAQTRTRELEALYRASQSLNQSLSVQQICETSVDALRDILGYSQVSIYFLKDNTLELQVERGYDHVIHTIDLSRGIMARSIRTRQAIFLEDVNRDGEFLATLPNLQSEIAVPLIHADQALGVLNVETTRPRLLTHSDVRLLSTFANQLVVAIENARLYEQTKRDADVKAALLRELSHRVKNNLAAITSLLYMALDEPPEAREQILLETLGRVQSMVLAHTLLARSDHVTVSLTELGRQVLNDTARQLSPLGSAAEVQVEGAAVEIAPRQITTLALVLNELVTNAIRHGFGPASHARSKILRLQVTRLGDKACFILKDNGVGLAPEFELGSNSGLGLNLVRTLVEKDLQGKFTIERCGKWTEALVEFELEA